MTGLVHLITVMCTKSYRISGRDGEVVGSCYRFVINGGRRGGRSGAWVGRRAGADQAETAGIGWGNRQIRRGGRAAGRGGCGRCGDGPRGDSEGGARRQGLGAGQPELCGASGIRGEASGGSGKSGVPPRTGRIYISHTDHNGAGDFPVRGVRGKRVVSKTPWISTTSKRGRYTKSVRDGKKESGVCFGFFIWDLLHVKPHGGCPVRDAGRRMKRSRAGENPASPLSDGTGLPYTAGRAGSAGVGGTGKRGAPCSETGCGKK